MKSVCLYFTVHQPFRLKKYQPEDIAVIHSYEDTEANCAAIDIAANQCYLPANEILYRLLLENKERFAVSFSISGIMLEMLRSYRPDVIASFQQLVSTGRVEILAETYYHSLSFLHSGHEFRRQVQKHSLLVKEIFGITPVVFRNTELIYNNDLARVISGMGYKGILCEGTERLLQGRSPNHLYGTPGNGDFSLLLRNQPLSDDIAFRFDDTNWQEYPLSAGKFASWLHAGSDNTELINLCLDYETFGLHKQEETGILRFLEELPAAVLENEQFQFSTPSDVMEGYHPRDIYDVPQPVSWEERRDMNCGSNRNTMQHNTLKKIYAIENMVMGCGNPSLVETWGQLQAADHFYCMTEEGFTNKKYQNPFTSAEEAFRNYTNILVDFEITVIRQNISLSRQRTTHYLPVYTLY